MFNDTIGHIYVVARTGLRTEVYFVRATGRKAWSGQRNGKHAGQQLCPLQTRDTFTKVKSRAQRDVRLAGRILDGRYISRHLDNQIKES